MLHIIRDITNESITKYIIFSIKCNKYGNLIICGGKNGIIRVYSMKTLKELGSYKTSK